MSFYSANVLPKKNFIFFIAYWIQVRILVQVIEKNKTLKGLSFTRKAIKDSEGVEICKCLMTNDCLERLELDGNAVGPNTLMQLAELLKTNTTLRSIDLEGNNLTMRTNFAKLKDSEKSQDLRNCSGIEQLAKALESNTTVLCLNLSNCELNEQCSEYLCRMMERNQTIINLDIDSNPDMNLYHVRAIQEYLKRNKKAYDDERYQEFIERKQMWRELNISNIIQANREAKLVLQENINTRIEAKRVQMETDWENKLKNEETLK